MGIREILRSTRLNRINPEKGFTADEALSAILDEIEKELPKERKIPKNPMVNVIFQKEWGLDTGFNQAIQDMKFKLKQKYRITQRSR